MHAMPLLTQLADLYSAAGLRVTADFQSQVKIYVSAVYAILLLGTCGGGRQVLVGSRWERPAGPR
jgi:hypothetical protein